MEILYAPWRIPYHEENRENQKKDICVFCQAISDNDDEKHGIFYKDEFCFCIMNKYPYSPGHFLIVPNLHIANLEELPKEVWLRMSEIAQKGVKLLKLFKAEGINMGLNLGEVSGAGIPKHLHLHLIPRWKYDTNFITTIGNTRVYSNDFFEIYKKIKELAKECNLVNN